MAGSGGFEGYSDFSSKASYGAVMPILLLRSFLERIEREFSTTYIEPLHSLIESCKGNDISCKASIA